MTGEQSFVTNVIYDAKVCKLIQFVCRKISQYSRTTLLGQPGSSSVVDAPRRR